MPVSFVNHGCGLVTRFFIAQVRLVWLQESGAWAKSFLSGRVPQWDKWDTIFVLFLLRQQAPVFQGRPWGPLSCYRGAGYGDFNPRMSIKPAGGHRANLSAMFRHSSDPPFTFWYLCACVFCGFEKIHDRADRVFFQKLRFDVWST